MIFKKKKAYVPYFIHTGDIVLLNRKYKYHKCLFAREIIFCYNTKSKGDVVCCFLRGRTRCQFPECLSKIHQTLSTLFFPLQLVRHTWVATVTSVPTVAASVSQTQRQPHAWTAAAKRSKVLFAFLKADKRNANCSTTASANNQPQLI